MNPGIPIELLLSYSSSIGVYTQLELDLGTPVYVFVNPKYLTSEPNGYTTIQPNKNTTEYEESVFSSLGHEDHPMFRDTRKWLEAEGYIKTESWWNGDTVLKPFFFNNVLLDAGDRFLCGSAMRHKFSSNFNEGIPDFTLKNYKEDYE